MSETAGPRDLGHAERRERAQAVPDAGAASLPLISAGATAALVALLVLLIVFTAIDLQVRPRADGARTMADFEAFYVSGRMYWEGVLNDAYGFTTLLEAQRRFTGTNDYMPWTYPPPYNIVTAGLALLPIGVAYLLFVGSSFAAYLWVLRRIAGRHLGAVVFAVLPAIALNIRSGQNGFLSGALLGLFFLAFVQGRQGGGAALGLMVFKPHLAVGAGLLALLDRRWRCVAVAASTVLVSCALATLLFGSAIWPAFLGGVQESGQFLKDGAYPLFRMISAYATVFTLSGSWSLAIGVQSALALLLAGLLALAFFSMADRRLVAAFAVVVCVFVSPYGYDYDLVVGGVAIALLLGSPRVSCEGPGMWGGLVLLWLGAGWGFAMTALDYGRAGGSPTLAANGGPLALSFLFLVAAGVLGCAALRKQSPRSSFENR